MTNIIEVITKEITDEYNEDTVREMVDEQIPEYLDSGWEEDFDNEYEAYCETCSDEAESAILNALIRTKDNKYTPLSSDEFCAIYDNLKEEWGL